MKKEKKAIKKDKEIEKNLINCSQMKITDLFEMLKTNEDGLNEVEADERLEEYGKNIIDFSNNNSLIKRIKYAIINPFNVVLILVAIVIFFTDVVLSTPPSYGTFIMLLIIVAISGVISFVQSEKSNNAAKKLQKMISNKIDVIRNEVTSEINIEDLVPGDIVKLGSRRHDSWRCTFYRSKRLVY